MGHVLESVQKFLHPHSPPSTPGATSPATKPLTVLAEKRPDTPAEDDPDHLVFIALSDFSARTKGRSVRAGDFNDDTTIGWIPAILGVAADGHCLDTIPYGAIGDLRVRPDLSARYRFNPIGNRPGLDIVFGNVVNTDGTPWESCTRTFLADAVKTLHDEFGIKAIAAFEHEFIELGTPKHAFPQTLEAFRNAEPIGTELVKLLSDAGFRPENWLPEYGPSQYEITVAPVDPVAAGDRALLVRDIVRDVYEAHGRKITFAPILAPEETGSGAHVHFGFSDLQGNNPLYDASRPGRLSALGGSFAAGIIRHAPALAAFFTPLVSSYFRLKPKHWSSARAFLGAQNREALLRIPPTNELGGRDPSKQVHLEFRGGDAGANPWLLLGVLFRAGIEGIRENLPAPEVVNSEQETLSEEEAAGTQLPTSLAEALDKLEADKVVSGWFHPKYLESYIKVKRYEIEKIGALSDEEQCKFYTNVY